MGSALVLDNNQLNSQESIKLENLKGVLNGKDDSTDMVNGIAYFLIVFATVFQDATNKLQYGEASLTEATENITKAINDAKTKQLEDDNVEIKSKISQCDPSASSQDFQKQQDAVTSAQQQYKLDDSNYQSYIQQMSPITTTDSDTTTSISQNNAQIYQIALYIIQVLSTLVNLLK